MPRVTAIHAQLRSDHAVGSRFRLRSWAYDGDEPIAGSATHGAVELAWMESGAALYAFEGAEVHVPAGQAVVVPSGVLHKTTILGPLRAGALWLEPEMVSEIALAMGLSGRQLVPGLVSSPGSIVALGHVVRAELQGNGAGRLLAAQGLAEAMTVAMLRAAPARVVHPTAHDPRILAALERMHDRYAEALTVDALAKAAGMSRFHFSRHFREEVGEAPYQYLIKLRLARAAELLRRERHSVTETAIAVGFGDVGRFARMFRERFGTTPTAYARD